MTLHCTERKLKKSIHFSQAPLSDQEKVDLIEKHMQSVMEILDLDLTDSSLKETPRRIAKMYVHEIFEGMHPENFPKISLFDNPTLNEDANMLLCRDISFSSFCKHHFLPFIGHAHLAYIPNKKIIGLSKLNRIVAHFAKRPQVQENLGVDITDCLQEILDTDNIAICLEAKHFCVVARGIQDRESLTRTHILRGEFKNCQETRTEFFEGIKNS